MQAVVVLPTGMRRLWSLDCKHCSASSARDSAQQLAANTARPRKHLGLRAGTPSKPPPARLRNLFNSVPSSGAPARSRSGYAAGQGMRQGAPRDAAGAGRRRGVLVRGGRVLDALAACSVVALDKTGTLTGGALVASGMAAPGAAAPRPPGGGAQGDGAPAAPGGPGSCPVGVSDDVPARGVGSDVRRSLCVPLERCRGRSVGVA
jgi:hypothetical protein